MKIFKKLFLKILWKLLVAVLGLAVLAIAVLNVAKFALYHEYYGMKTDICKNPGLRDGFMCQGIAASEENDLILVSGYMANGSASRIYAVDSMNQSHYVQLKQGDKDFKGHSGGIATAHGKVYLASGGRIYTMALDSVALAQSGASVDIGEGVAVNNEASFVYTDDEYLYVGEFHNGKKYDVKGHENETAEGTHYAICSVYSLDDLTKPIKIYSIRNKVQGICFTPDGKVILSTSYGLTDSVYCVYDLNEATDSGKTMDGAPLYYLDHVQKEIKGPAMSEGLDYRDGKVITLTESSSVKYLFGKLFGANKIVGLDF
jgi:hypothetical protein